MAGDTSGVLELATNGSTTAITIDTSQNVGIGTASPSQRLQVKKDQTADTAIVVSNAGTANAATTMSFVLAESTTPQGWFRRYRDGTGFTEIGYSDVLTFSGNVTGTKAERMRINSSGALLINRTTQLNSERFAITGNSSSQCMALISPTSAGYDMCNINNSNGQVGLISTSGSSTAYQTSSDYRLKDNVKPMVNALDKVSLLKPVTYKWKVDGTNGQGFIAHELAEVVPDCVSGEKDAVNEDGSIKPQGVDTSFLVATLTAAIQEQNKIINDLKARVETLEGAKLG